MEKAKIAIPRKPRNGQNDIYKNPPTESELNYWEALQSGDKLTGLRAEPTIVRPDLTAWQAFDATWHPSLQQVIGLITEWYNNHLTNGRGVILAGNCGCGKTHLAKAIRDIHVLRVKYWTEISLIGAIQNSFNNKTGRSKAEILNEIDRAELFILDDLGSYKTDNLDWMQSIYMDLFDLRCDQKRPFLITTNLTKDEIPGKVGLRVCSRIFGALKEKRFFIELFDVPDYRIKNWKD